MIDVFMCMFCLTLLFLHLGISLFVQLMYCNKAYILYGLGCESVMQKPVEQLIRSCKLYENQTSSASVHHAGCKSAWQLISETAPGRRALGFCC